MQLTVRDVARLMQVPERTVHRWVHNEQLPAQQVGGQLHFNRLELFEWASSRKLPMPADFLGQLEVDADDADTLAAALTAGGVLHDTPGDDRESALAAVVDRMPLPDGFDRRRLLELFLTRESLGSTGVGDGIAIPHPRYPVVLSVPCATATICFLRRPIDFAAPDGKPVDTLFVLVSPTVRSHHKLLSELAAALSDDAFRAVIRQKAKQETILSEVRRLRRAAVAKSPDNGHS